jgi:flagellar hook-associated protein 2
MATISGIGTSRSWVEDQVQIYLEAERAQLQRLQVSRSTIQEESQGWVDLAQQLRLLRSAVSRFRWGGISSPIHTFEASSSDESQVRAHAGAAASAGIHTITVSSLARAHSIASDALIGDDISSLAGSYTFELVQGEESHQVTVEIEEGSSNAAVLSAVARAVNDLNAGVTASLATVDQADGSQRLLMTSQTSGTIGLIRSVQDLNGDLTSALGLAGTSSEGGYSANTLQTAADAHFTIDGLEFHAYRNSVDDALSGLTIELRQITQAPVTLRVERDVESVTAEVQGLLDRYNEALSFVREMTAGADAEGQGRGLFTGDTLFMSLRSQLRRLVTSSVADPANPAAPTRLMQLGITVARDGMLSVSDADALAAAIGSQPAAVERLFADEEEGIAVRLAHLLDTYVGAGGLIGQQQDRVRGREQLLARQILREEQYLEDRELQLTDQLAALQASVWEMQQQLTILNTLMS